MAARDDAFRRPPTAAAGRTTPRNHLLEALSQEDWTLIEPHLERVHLNVGDVLDVAEDPGPWLHFPESAIISIVSTMADGRSVEVGTVGNEGMAGLPTYLQVDDAAGSTGCRVAGAAQRMKARDLVVLAGRRPTLRRLLGRYIGAYLTLLAQGTACNKLHGLEQRCARWLLITHDRVDGDRLAVGSDYVASMLGVPRTGALLAISALRQHGLIRSARQGISILDREGLELASCECYGVVRRRFDRLA